MRLRVLDKIRINPSHISGYLRPGRLFVMFYYSHTHFRPLERRANLFAD